MEALRSQTFLADLSGWTGALRGCGSGQRAGPTALHHAGPPHPRYLFPMRALLLAILLTSCTAETLAPLPLEITIRASPIQAAPGDSIRFEIDAQGGSLVGIIIDYGDEGIQLFPASGARTARAVYRHAYARTGVYGVAATVTDAVAGDKTATVIVNIR